MLTGYSTNKLKILFLISFGSDEVVHWDNKASYEYTDMLNAWLSVSMFSCQFILISDSFTDCALLTVSQW